MRIAYISNEYPPETGLGGIGTYTCHIAEGMAARGHAVSVFCRSIDNRYHETTLNGVHIFRLSAGTYPLPAARIFFALRAFLRRGFPQSLIRLAWARQAAYHLQERTRLDGRPFDIVEYPECGAEGVAVPRHTCGPTVARLHTPWEMIRALDRIPQGRMDCGALDFLEKRSVIRADAVSSPTRALLGIMQKKWGFTGGSAIPNPIPANNYRVAQGTSWIYTGRVEHRKGVHILIKAYAELCQGSSPPPLTLLGRPFGTMADGMDYGTYIEQLITSHNLTHRIQWVRGVPSSEVARFLSGASAAIFPSLWENLPYSCMEAMACGLAVVASRCGGYEEMIVHGESGMLFTPQDSADLARQLKQLIDEPALAARLGSAAQKQVRTTYDTAVILPRMESFYETVSQKGSAHE